MSFESTKQSAQREAKGLKDEAIDRAMEVFETAKNDAAAAGRAAQRTASDLASDLVRRLKDAGVDTDQLVIQAKDQATELQRAMLQEIRNRPMRALGVAAAAGLLIGLLSMRR